MSGMEWIALSLIAGIMAAVVVTFWKISHS
jgi:hypothetical protein